MRESFLFISKIASNRTVPVSLLIVCALSYGLLIPWLGFYWDDWSMIWVSHSLGPAGLRELWSYDRPFLGWLYTLTTSMLGEAPLYWHLLALFTRWLTAVGVWWCLRAVWPERVQEVSCIAFLFAVYPGFLFQPFAVTISHVFIALTLFILSLGATIWALRVKRMFWPLTILALISSGLSLFFLETYVGLELLRPVLLWLVIGEHTADARQRIRGALVRWSPYLAVLGIYLIWRVFFFNPPLRDFDESVFLARFVANPLYEMAFRIRNLITDVVESGLMAWAQTFRPDIFDLGSSSVWVAWGVVFAIAIIVALYLLRPESGAGEAAADVQSRWMKQAILVGLFAILAGGMPVWFAGRQVHLDNVHNRFTSPMMLGACLFLAGLIFLMIRTRLQRIIVISLMVGLAGGVHFRNANQLRRDWSSQKSLYWQLSWRAPFIKPGTAVLMENPQLLYSADYTLGGALNLTYGSQQTSPKLDYWVFFLTDANPGNRRSDVVEISQLASRGPVVRDKRNIRLLSFDGSATDSLVIWYDPRRCLRVLDPSRDELPHLPPLLRAARPYSNIDRIEVNTDAQVRPLAKVFGPEPERCWCYYFQKADLARQMGDWQKVAELGDEAQRLGLKPEDPTEWLPFVEGYTLAGRFEDAKRISELAVKDMPTVRLALSTMMDRLDDIKPQDGAHMEFIRDMSVQLSYTMQ